MASGQRFGRVVSRRAGNVPGCEVLPALLGIVVVALALMYLLAGGAIPAALQWATDASPTRGADTSVDGTPLPAADPCDGGQQLSWANYRQLLAERRAHGCR